MPEIIVQGSAEARLMPTDAMLTVTVETRSPAGQAAAVDACGRQSEQVDALLDASRDGVVTSVVTSSLRTGPVYEHEPRGGRRLVGHMASRTSEVGCLPQGEALTELVAALSRMDDVRVAGPDWQVAVDDPGWDAVRSAATADARRRAEAYAAGLDVGVGRPTVIAEPGLRLPGGSPSPMAFASARSARADMGGGEEAAVAVRIVPEPVTVSVSIEVSFDLG